MKRKILLTLAVLLLTVAAVTPPILAIRRLRAAEALCAAPIVAPAVDPFHRNIAATVRISTPSACATGVIVGPGLVLTAGHAVCDAKEVAVELWDDNGFRTLRGEVVKSDDLADLGLVRVSEPLASPVVLGLGVAADIRAGTPCVAIGATAGHTPHNITSGWFSGKQVDPPLKGMRMGLWQVSCAGFPGNSGCGVYSGGELIGICITGDSPCTMFIVPVWDVASFLKGYVD